MSFCMGHSSRRYKPDHTNRVIKYSALRAVKLAPNLAVTISLKDDSKFGANDLAIQ
jgi:hypothetical protein